MPVLFVGHGNPMNALGQNEFAVGWRSLVEDLPVPKAVLCVSAHWETRGALVGGAARPATIHDFYGFPEALYKMTYPCPGSPGTASRVRRLVTEAGTDPDRGLDHGAWAVLCHMFPAADVPVLQLSLPAALPAQDHFRLGLSLAPLRDEGVLVVGSGNLVHNLPMADMRAGAEPYGWALRFDQLAAELILAGDSDRLVRYQSLGPDAKLAIPTNEHYLPLLYALALRRDDDRVTFVNARVAHGSVGMRSVRFGQGGPQGKEGPPPAVDTPTE